MKLINKKKCLIILIFAANSFSSQALPRCDANGKLLPQSSPCTAYGEYSYGFPSKIWNCATTFSIGNFCSIATEVTLFLGGNHRTDWVTTYPFASFIKRIPEGRLVKEQYSVKGKIVIMNDVWIGEGVTILSGVTIGNGAVVGANAVVAKSVPPYAVVVGNPARVVKFRFDSETVKKLLAISWWNWPIERIRKNIHLLCDDNIQAFIEANYERI